MEEIIINDEAYKYDRGPVLLLAGPGTGKTWQLAQRIKFLTNEKNVPADEITVITFTKEAASGMRDKLKKKGGNEYIEPNKRPNRIFTMHQLGHRILTDNLSIVGLQKDFTVVEKIELKKPLMRDAAVLLGYTERDANEALEDRTKANIQLSGKSQKIISKYEEILRFCNALDYDDQIGLACKLLEENDELRKKYAQNSKYLLVDEYQDINHAQFNLIELLSKDNRTGLFVVGDDDQSIYSFRGGSPIFIRNFKNHFGSNSIIIQMQTSRRCPVNILECANYIITQFDLKRLPKNSYIYTKTNPGKVIVHDCPSDDREAEIIAIIIKSDAESLDPCGQCKQLPKRIYFVLVPNKNYSRKVQQKFQEFRISFDSKIRNENKSFSCFSTIKDWVIDNSSNLLTRQSMELLIESGNIESLPNSKVRSVEKLKTRIDGLKEIANLWEKAINDRKSLFEILLEKSNDNKLVKEIFGKLQELKISYLSAKVPNFIERVALYTKPWSSLDNFFDEINRGGVSSSSTIQGPHVRILTMQNAKGLQANEVFIIGLEEDVIPRKVSTDEALAEEARLFFVGMTRAEEHLHLFKCRKRVGSATYKPIPYDRKPSCFLAHLPKGKYEMCFHQPKDKIAKKN